jgi:NADH-quinone oxidoreductase subunit F
MSALRYFEDEFRAHIEGHRCPALVCEALIAYYIQPDRCQGCGRCRKACPVDAIRGDKRMIHIIDQDVCIQCGTCLDICPERFSAVARVSGDGIQVPGEPIPVGSWSD